MAIASLHNISVHDSSFLRESQSQASRQHGDERRPSTRASSLLQRWRVLQDENVVSRFQDGYSEMLHQQRNDGLIPNLSRADVPQNDGTEQRAASENRGISQNVDGFSSCNLSRTEHEVQQNTLCDRSDDLGEVERERVREIFQEWTNISRRERAPNVSHLSNNSRGGCFGDTEQERVRTMRGWVQRNNDPRGVCRESREERATEIGGQIGRRIDGFVVNQIRNKRGNRKLCGRQVLLDMLHKAERERRMELQDLMMHRAVSQFAHRNRIQSLLRGRFLRNDRIVEDKKPSSMAASELGLLRQRHTVSGRREGFISRLGHSGRGQESSSYSDTLSNSNISGNSNDQTEVNNSHEELDEFHGPSEPNNQDSDSCGLTDDRNGSEGNGSEDISQQESCTHAEDWQEQESEHGARDWLPSPSVEFIEGNEVTRQNLDGNWEETSSTVWSEEMLQNQEGENSHPQEAVQILYEQYDPFDWLPSANVEYVERNDVNVQHCQGRVREANRLFYEQSEITSDDRTANVLSDHTDNAEGNMIEDMTWQEFVVQVENDETDWQGESLEYNNEWIGEDMDENQQDMTGNEWSQELLAIEGRDDVYMQESPQVWHEEGSFQDSVQNWLEGPSSQQTVPLGRVDTSYILDDDDDDDDNANRMELRELLSRRRVSNLLDNGFGASLDRLLQSYLERQSRPSIDWELNETEPIRLSGEPDLEQQSRDQNDDAGFAAGSPPLALPSPLMLPDPSIWDSDSHNDNWQQHDMRPRMGMEWEIINDMRIDMARLHQRMNNMQRMLETCMDMQLELQRSIRQEVTAALNRSATLPGLCVDGFPEDGSKWDLVRKGICCLCHDSNIDSLLYRCGHMCTCSKCANGLVQTEGKCPMCLAPVTEVIRACSMP